MDLSQYIARHCIGRQTAESSRSVKVRDVPPAVILFLSSRGLSLREKVCYLFQDLIQECLFHTELPRSREVLLGLDVSAQDGVS